MLVLMLMVPLLLLGAVQIEALLLWKDQRLYRWLRISNLRPSCMHGE